MIKGVIWAILAWVAIGGALVAMNTDVSLWARTLSGSASTLAILLGVTIYDPK